MVEIKINDTGSSTDSHFLKDTWNCYLECEDCEKQVVLFGNKTYVERTNVEWFERAKNIIESVIEYGEVPEELPAEVSMKIRRLCKEHRYEVDLVVEVLKCLYPEELFKIGTIKGYQQSEWQHYITCGDVDVMRLESFYFGKVASIAVIRGEGLYESYVITHDELWKAEKGDLKKFMREYCGIAEDEELQIYEAKGTIQTLDWRRVC